MTEIKQTSKNTKYPTFEDLVDLFLTFEKWPESYLVRYVWGLWGVKQWILTNRKEDMIDYIDSINKKTELDKSEKSMRDVLGKPIIAALNDENNPDAKKFLQYLRFILSVCMFEYNNEQIPEFKFWGYQAIEEILNMTDSRIKYEALVECVNKFPMGPELEKAALKYIVKSGKAEIWMFQKLSYLYLIGSTESLEIFKDAEVRAGEIIDEELKKEMPDNNRIENTVRDMNNVAEHTGDPRIIFNTKEHFYVDKIFTQKLDTSYRANIKDSTTTRLARLEEENEELTDKVIGMQAKIAEKDKELSRVRSEKEALQRELEELRQNIINLHAESENMQASLLSRGVNRVKGKIYELELIARAKEERTK